MPKGDPAGYLPSVVKSRQKQGEPAYQPRSKRAKAIPKFRRPSKARQVTD